MAITYTHFEGEKEELRIEPYSIMIHDHQLYVVARRLTDHVLHPFRFSRISQADRDDKKFEYPKNYDPAALFAGSFGIFLNDNAELVRVSVRLAATLDNVRKDAPLAFVPEDRTFTRTRRRALRRDPDLIL